MEETQTCELKAKHALELLEMYESAIAESDDPTGSDAIFCCIEDAHNPAMHYKSLSPFDCLTVLFSASANVNLYADQRPLTMGGAIPAMICAAIIHARESDAKKEREEDVDACADTPWDDILFH